MAIVEVCDNCGEVFRKQAFGFFPSIGKKVSIIISNAFNGNRYEFCCMTCARDFLSKQIGVKDGEDK